MKINELIKKIRLKNNYSYRKIAEKTGFSSGFINDVEKGRASMSDNLFEAYLKNFPMYKKELIQAFKQQKISNISFEEEGFEDVTNQISFFKFKVYNFQPEGDGRVELTKFSEVDFMQTYETGNLILEKGFVFNICDDSLAPVFLRNDKIVFLKERFENWEKLDSRLILVKVSGKMYIRKLFFENGIPFLFSFNERLYPKINILDSKNVEFIGVLYKRLDQDLSNFKF